MKRIVTSRAVLFTFVCIISMSVAANTALAGLSDGLVAYYPFNGNANDESGNGNNGTIYGATLTTDRFGNTNKAYSFDGVDDYVNCGTGNGSFNFSSYTNFTLAVWIKTAMSPSSNTWPMIISKETGPSVRTGYNIVINPADSSWGSVGTVFIEVFSSSKTSGAVSTTLINDNQWHYIVGIRRGNTIEIYVDGSLENSRSCIEDDISNNMKMVIGKHSTNNSSFLPFKGTLNDIRIYNRALSESEIQELYNEGTTPTKPTVTTDAATNVKSNSATLNGKVNANGGTTTAWFEYGMTSGTYSNTTSTNTASGWSDTDISADASGLSSGTAYYYRAVAQNSEGAAYGSETSFTTLAPPDVVTGNATSITMISATLNGTVNAKGTSTTAWFEYGTVSGAYNNTTTQRSVSGSSDTAVGIYVSGLSFGTTYYYRLVAENAAGTAYGSEKSFATTSATSPTPTPTQTPAPTQVPSPTPGTTPSPVISPTPVITPILTPSPLGTGIVFGYVYDEDENPLRSVTVNIDGDGYSDSGTTDEDGYYEFTDVPAGDYTITYTKKGYQTQTMDVTVEEGDAVQAESVVMPAVLKGTIYGYVTDIRGNPLESVKLKLAGIGMKAKKTASTDSDGFFEFTDLEAGRYRIVAKKRFYKAAQQTVELEEGEDKEIEIEMKKTTKRGLLMTEEIR